MSVKIPLLNGEESAADRRSKYRPGQEVEYWPTEISIGRWLHAVGDDLEEGANQ